MHSQELPQRVNFSPRFLRQFSDWLHHQPAALSQIEAAGLLFGAQGLQDAVVQSYRPFPNINPTRQHHLHQAFEHWQRRTDADPELTWLDLLGWFCIRPQSTGELLPADVKFHNRHFLNPSKLAVIFHSPEADTIAAELYTNSPDSPLHITKHRRVSVRLSIGADLPAPAIRPKLHDNAFLHAYQIASALDRAERWEEFKDKVHRLTHFEWLRRG